MILVRNIRLPLSAGEAQAFEKALHALHLPRGKAQHLGVAKLSVDARRGQPKLVYTVAVTLSDTAEEAAFAARCPDASLHSRVDFSVQNGTRPLTEAVVTRGGVSVKEIDPATMESKKIRGLYAAGELLDVDAMTGGFNLQIAFSTGRLAGMSAAEPDAF